MEDLRILWRALHAQGQTSQQQLAQGADLRERLLQPVLDVLLAQPTPPEPATVQVFIYLVQAEQAGRLYSPAFVHPTQRPLDHPETQQDLAVARSSLEIVERTGPSRVLLLSAPTHPAGAASWSDGVQMHAALVPAPSTFRPG